MTPLEAIVGQLDAFLIAHHREVDAWAERRHAEIHAMAVARTRGMGQLFRHATARVTRIALGADFLEAQARAMEDIRLILDAPFPYPLHMKEIR